MLKAPAKITFKNSTKISLNARFTQVMKSRPATTAQTVRAQTSTERLASEKNRRLALQMERRPAVEAALGTKPVPGPSPRASIHDRLGRGRGRGATPRGQGGFRSGAVFRGTSAAQRARGILRGAMRRGNRGRGTVGLVTSSKRGGRGSMANKNARSPAQSFRGGRGRGSFRGRGGKRGRGAQVNKNKLDSDLDSYMSKTRGSMDAELDAYMANAGEI